MQTLVLKGVDFPGPTVFMIARSIYLQGRINPMTAQFFNLCWQIRCMHVSVHQNDCLQCHILETEYFLSLFLMCITQPERAADDYHVMSQISEEINYDKFNQVYPKLVIICSLRQTFQKAFMIYN